MTSRDIFELLRRIDDGYKCTSAEKIELLSIKNIVWKEIAKIPDSIGNLINLQNLDLSSTQINSLPESIGSLTNLQSLDLSSTQISYLPEGLWKLANLQNLDLSWTGLSDISVLSGLTGLTNLNLAGTSVRDISALYSLTTLKNINLAGTNVKDISALYGLTALTNLNLHNTRVNDISALSGLIGLMRLDLGDTDVSDISALFGLTALKNLDLSRTSVRDISALYGLTALKNLNLSGTSVRDISALYSLTTLKNLNLAGTNVKDISALYGLTALTNLDLHNTRVNDISALSGLIALIKLDLGDTDVSNISALYGLTALKSLNLNHTQVRQLSLNIGRLTSLRFLDLSFTWVNELPTSFGNLNNLLELDLSCTRIRDISSISGLSSLRSLKLHETRIENIISLSDLIKLVVLDISVSQVIDISALGKLKSLKRLDISGTRVTDVSSLVDLLSLSQLDMAWVPVTDISALSNLTQLNRLNIFETPVHDVSPLAGLKSLKNICFAKTKLDYIPDFLLDLNLDFINEEMGEEDGIYIKDLSIRDDPIEIFYQPRNQIIEYLMNKNENNNDIVGECKVVFLGDPGAGKSLIVDRLLLDGESPQYFGDMTRGIRISSKSYLIRNDEIVLHFWDFGGQTIYHSLHHIFLSQRTLYIIVLNARHSTVDEQAKYWLREVKTYAYGSPVLLVINQADFDQYSSINEGILREFYPYIAKKIVKISALRDTTESFNSSIVGEIFRCISDMKSVYTYIPKTWKSVLRSLHDMAQYYITIEQYEYLCECCGVLNYSDIWQSLLDWISDLGIRVLLSREDSTEDQLIAKPSWLIDAIISIFSSGRAFSKNGIVQMRDLYLMLEFDRGTNSEYRYSMEEVSLILKVLYRFEISVELKDGMIFFPMFCERSINNKNLNFIKSKGMHYIFKYDSLPERIIHRLMVKMHDDLDLDIIWYFGAVFKNNVYGSLACVKGSLDKIDIYVKAIDSLHDESEYLNVLRSKIQIINHEMNIMAKEYICYSEYGVEDEFSVASLIAYKELGITTIYAEQLGRLISINDIMRTTAIASKSIVDEIIACLLLLQNNRNYYEAYEDRLNVEIRNMLVARGYICKDQRVSSLSNSMRSFEIDLIISDYRNGKDVYFEGYLTKSFNRNLLQTHIEKLLSTYKPLSNHEMILVIYIRCSMDMFSKLSNRYLKYLLSQKELRIDGELFYLYRNESVERESTIHSIKNLYLHNNVPFSVNYILTLLPL